MDDQKLTMYGVYSLELEKEVTQWSYQELRRDKSVVGVKVSLPLKSWNIYHNILNKITNNYETSGCYVVMFFVILLKTCDKLKDCIKFNVVFYADSMFHCRINSDAFYPFARSVIFFTRRSNAYRGNNVALWE